MAKDETFSKEDEQLLREYEQEVERERQAGGNYNSYASTGFGNQNKMNLVEWQLDFTPELADIERLLRCDILIRDKDGNEMWIRNPNKDRVIFNDVGVNDILREIKMFLNKNKVLSNYGVEEIKPRIKMIGHELRMLIYNNYESYGMDNDYKINNYSMVVLTILSMIEDSYRRAINGDERKDLNQARIVNQNEPIAQPNNQYVLQMPQKKGSMLNPFNWGR